MHTDEKNGTGELRERGRGRKAFWIVAWAAVIGIVLYAAWVPREPAPELTVAGVDSALALSSSIWAELTPEQREELVAYWNSTHRRWRR